MAQVDFAASSVAEALRVGPYEVDLSFTRVGSGSTADSELQRERAPASMTRLVARQLFQPRAVPRRGARRHRLRQTRSAQAKKKNQSCRISRRPRRHPTPHYFREHWARRRRRQMARPAAADSPPRHERRGTERHGVRSAPFRTRPSNSPSTTSIVRPEASSTPRSTWMFSIDHCASRQPLAGSVTTRPRSKALVATVRVLPAHDLAR